MPNQEKAGAVLYAKDIVRVSAFYAEVAGMAITHAEKDFITLESPVFQFVVVAMPASIAATIEIATPPVRREDTPIKLIFGVQSISAARATAARLGGELNGPEREWQFQGERVCDGHDPEGNVVQFQRKILKPNPTIEIIQASLQKPTMTVRSATAPAKSPCKTCNCPCSISPQSKPMRSPM